MEKEKENKKSTQKQEKSIKTQERKILKQERKHTNLAAANLINLTKNNITDRQTHQILTYRIALLLRQ